MKRAIVHVNNEGTPLCPIAFAMDGTSDIVKHNYTYIHGEYSLLLNALHLLNLNELISDSVTSVRQEVDEL